MNIFGHIWHILRNRGLKGMNKCKHPRPTKKEATEGTYYKCPDCNAEWFATRRKRA